MATKKKLLQAAAGSAGGAGLNVEEVFSTYLYEGNASTQTISNNIDLDGEGGMVWLKSRSANNAHEIDDTERGVGKLITPNSTAAEVSQSEISAFNSDGFDLRYQSGRANADGEDIVSWTWRKAPKFFDVVTYTGDGVAGREIAHNLGTTVGTIITKRLDTVSSWAVWHKDIAATDFLYLNSTNAVDTNTFFWDSTAPTSTHFTVGTRTETNASGGTYVAYLFAHNDGDGEFGPDGDQDIIKCGSFTEGASGASIDLGFEPQFILFKRASGVSDWYMLDTMRGMPVDGADSVLVANSSSAETNIGDSFDLTPTGFNVNPLFGSNETSIYIAIRRGPMAVPTDATEVFDIKTYTGDGSNPRKITTTLSYTDLVLGKTLYNQSNDDPVFYDRLRGNGISLETSTSDAEAIPSGSGYDVMFDTNDGFLVGNPWNAFFNYSNYDVVAGSWKRAPSFCDVVAYTGDGTSGRTVSHNLGVAPEMIWVKRRNGASGWRTYHSAVGNTAAIYLSSTSTPLTYSFWWNDTSPTSSNFTVGNHSTVNGSGNTYIAYLFASLAGVSKVGSYTGNGSSQTIDCGFSSGARFVLIKRTDDTGDWYVWDTERGIVAGNDSHISLNRTSTEVTTDDSIDPASSGFAVNQVSATNINVSSAEYIFYAIA